MCAKMLRACFTTMNMVRCSRNAPVAELKEHVQKKKQGAAEWCNVCAVVPLRLLFFWCSVCYESVKQGFCCSLSYSEVRPSCFVPIACQMFILSVAQPTLPLILLEMCLGIVMRCEVVSCTLIRLPENSYVFILSPSVCFLMRCLLRVEVSALHIQESNWKICSTNSNWPMSAQLQRVCTLSKLQDLRGCGIWTILAPSIST